MQVIFSFIVASTSLLVCNLCQLLTQIYIHAHAHFIFNYSYKVNNRSIRNTTKGSSSRDKDEMIDIFNEALYNILICESSVSSNYIIISTNPS